MKRIHLCKISLSAIAAFAVLFLAIPQDAAAHCDTLDGPVVQDARKAIEAKDITPVLKWVKPGDENAVRAAFSKVVAARGKNAEAAELQFFATLVKFHRAGEGARFTGLKPAGAVEPVIAEADRALASGSADALVKLVVDDVAAGIKERYGRAVAAYRHKDESVAQGREFVEAYVAYTHYVEGLHGSAVGNAAHDEHREGGKHSPARSEAKHHTSH